jgi:hypothetical protein
MPTMPTYPFTVNFGNSLTTNLIAAYAPGITGVDIAALGPTLTYDANAVKSSTTEGPAVLSDSSGSPCGLFGTATSPFKSWTGFTIYWRGYIIGACDNYADLAVVSYDNSGQANSPYLVAGIQATPSYSNVEVGWNIGGTFSGGQLPQDVTGDYGTMISIAVTLIVNGNVYIYLNGAGTGPALFGASGPTSTSTSQVQINSLGGGSGASPNAYCNVCYFWNTALTSTQISNLDASPYQFLQSSSPALMSATMAFM